MSEIQNNLLKRQLDQVKTLDGQIDLDALIELIDKAYQEADRERRLSDHSLALMSKELLETNQELQKQAQQLKDASRQLAHSARASGMAEVATNVLHNIGNILNSVNTSCSILKEKIHNSKLKNLAQIKALFQEHQSDLASYLSQDPKGKILPEYIQKLADFWEEEQKKLIQEADLLYKNIEHIKECVNMQQSLAGSSNMFEPASLTETMDAVLMMQASGIEAAKVHVHKDYAFQDIMMLDRVKLYQVLINLVQNAKHATMPMDQPSRDIWLSIRKDAPDTITVEVKDNGIGILSEHMAKLFTHGFTTRKDGHGFGLHYCSLAAKEMGGTLVAQSEGLHKGATFTLTLPYRPLQPQGAS